MEITTAKPNAALAELTIVVTPEELAPFRSKAVKSLGEQVKIDGFRKGHVPEQVLVQRFGEPTLMAETIQVALPEIVSTALEQEKLMPIVRPDVDVVEITPVTLKVTVQLPPVVEIPDYDKVDIKGKKVTVSKKDKDEAMERIQERFEERKPVERAAKKDDHVVVNFSGATPDGVSLEGTDSKSHPLILGLKTFIPGFEEGIEGMKVGETKVLELTFPEDYHAKHLAGKEVHFTIDLLEVNERVKPEAGPALAMDVFGEEMTSEEFMAKVDEILLENNEQQERERQENELMQSWMKSAKVELPPIFVDEESRIIKEQMEARLKQMGMDLDQHAQMLKKTTEEMEASFREQGEERAKQRAVIGWVINQENPEISPEAIDHEVSHDSRSVGADAQMEEQIRRQAEYKLKIEAVLEKYLPGYQELATKKHTHHDHDHDHETVETKPKKVSKKKKTDTDQATDGE